jgi:hypothetical protein
MSVGVSTILGDARRRESAHGIRAYRIFTLQWRRRRESCSGARSRKFLVVTRRQGVWKVSWGQNTRLRADVPDSECFATLRKRGG